MQIDTTHIDAIRASFKQMQTKEDFLKLLNYAKPHAYAGKTIPFEMKQLNFYLKNRKPVEQSVLAIKDDVTEKPVQNVMLLDIQKKVSDKKTIIEADSRYLSFQIKKKSGGLRTIHAPKPGLKALQKTLSFILQTVFTPHPSAMGFVQGKSIVDNANVHTGQNYVYNIDLVDFFPSVDQARVWKCLQLKPFDLKQNNLNRNGIPTSRIAILNTFLQPHSIEKLITDLTERFVEETPTFYLHLFRALNAFDASTNNFKCNPDFYYAQGTKRTKIKLTEESTEIFNRLFINLDQVNNELEFKEFNSLIISWMTKLRKFGEMLVENPRAMTVELQLEDEQISISQVIKNIYATNIFKIDPRQEIASMIASLCCIEVPNVEIEKKGERKFPKNVLPQGAPTSPMFSNVICQRLDYLLSAVAKRFGLKYSRYADDITFSSMHNVYQPGSEFLIELERIITQQGFKVNSKKTRLHKDGYRKEVTGLLVNEKTNVQQRYIKQLRMWLYYWERYRYAKTYNYFLKEYNAEKGHTKKGKPDMTNVIAGKLDYLKMVKGADNELYLKLKSRFDALTVITKDEIIKAPIISLASIISIVDLEDNSTKKEDAYQQNTDKLRININSIDSAKGQNKLKRQIIIKKGESLPLEELLENNEEEEKEIDLSKHKPIDVTGFLLNFRSSEGLKFLTHDYDKPGSVFDYDKIIAISKKEFKELSKKFIVPVNLFSRINQFAFGDPSHVWWFNKLPYKLNWQAPELLRWMEANPIKHPINNEIFEKGFILPFKKSIEIKSPDLEYIFKNKLAENLASNYLSFDIQLVDLDKANFYTNVDALQVGISYIVKSINQRFKNSNKIRVEFSRKADEEGRKRIIKIIHLGSECDKPFDKRDLFQGDLLEAEKALFGICDWSIISKTPDDTVNKLNVLFDISSNKIPKEKIDDSLIEGFTHVLTFYA